MVGATPAATDPVELGPVELDALLGVAREAAAAGQACALDWSGRLGELRVQEKAASDDLVSQADREAEAAILGVLAARRPRDGVLGEETGASLGSTAITWVVDPIDGTTNYLYGRPDWAVSVAALSGEDQRVVAAVVLEPALGRATWARLGGGTRADGHLARARATTDLSRALVEVNFGRPEQRDRAGRTIDALVCATRDVRRGGSAAAALAQVATGRAEAYWGPGLQPWDAAAGLLLVTESGGRAGGLASAGEPAVWPAGGDVLASVPALWSPLQRLLQDVGDA